MTPFTTCARLLGRIARAALAVPLLAAALCAQVPTGSITGYVYDEASGRSLRGAVVTVRGSASTDYTDVEGRFQLPGIAAGEVTLNIDYVGLDPVTRTVSVTAGRSASVSIPMKGAVYELAAFEVKESARGQALAINQQKTAAGIVNIVSEETFGNMPSGNIGYALQRLPGISVDEDQDGSPSEVNLRGVPGEFNSVQLDGNRLPSSGGTSRSVNMKNLVGDGVTTIEVIKAATPDRDGDAIGGIINIVSRTAFQRDGREWRLVGGTSYNDLSEKWGYDGRVTYSDIFGLFGKEKNFGISITATSYTTDRYSENADIDWERVTPSNFPALGLTAPTKFLEASHSERSFRTTHTKGLSASFDFRTDAHNSFYFRPNWTHYDQNSQTYETDWDIDKRFQNTPTGRHTYAFLSPDGSYGGGTPGSSGSQASLGYIGTDDNSHNDLWNWALGGRHERDTSTLTYDVFYSTSTYVRPNFTEFNIVNIPAAQGYYVMQYDASNRLRPKFTITNGLSPTDFAYTRQGPTNLIIVPRSKEEEIYSARADWEKKFIGEKITNALKIGAKYRANELEYNQDNATYQVPANSAASAAFDFGQVVTPASGDVLGFPRYQYADQAKARAYFAAHPEFWTYVTATSFNGSHNADYDAEEDTTAGYVMDTVTMGRNSVIAGVRWEQNTFSRTNTRAIVTNPGPVYSTQEVSSSGKYDLWLPGIHFRHELAKNLILRESYNRSYGRPKLADIARGRSETIAASGAITITDGNSDLKPSDSNNYDIQLEYYTDNGGLYSVSVFMKDIKNFTYNQVTRFDQLDAEGKPIPAASGLNTYTQPLNGPGAKNRGIELIARQRLYFLPGPLSGLSADVSATFTKSKAEIPGREDDDIPLEGFSEYLFTSSLSYAWGRFSARVDYRYRDDYIEGLDDGIDTDEWFSAREQVDAEFSIRLFKGLTFFAAGTNLTHRPQVSYTGSREFPEDVSYSGRKYSMGFDYKF